MGNITRLGITSPELTKTIITTNTASKNFRNISIIFPKEEGMGNINPKFRHIVYALEPSHRNVEVVNATKIDENDPQVIFNININDLNSIPIGEAKAYAITGVIYNHGLKSNSPTPTKVGDPIVYLESKFVFYNRGNLQENASLENAKIEKALYNLDRELVQQHLERLNKLSNSSKSETTRPPKPKMPVVPKKTPKKEPIDPTNPLAPMNPPKPAPEPSTPVMPAPKPNPKMPLVTNENQKKKPYDPTFLIVSGLFATAIIFGE